MQGKTVHSRFAPVSRRFFPEIGVKRMAAKHRGFACPSTPGRAAAAAPFPIRVI